MGMKLLVKYQPETKAVKAERIEALAKAAAAGEPAAAGAAPNVLKFGLKHVTTLIEQKKTCAVVALTSVAKEDESKLTSLQQNFKAQFNNKFERKWGGGIMGLKTQAKLEKRRKAVEAELAKAAQVHF